MFAWEAPAGTNGKIQRISYMMNVETSSYMLYVMLKNGGAKKISMCFDKDFPNPTDRIALYEGREEREEIALAVPLPKPVMAKESACSLM